MQWEFSFLYALQELHNPILDKIMIQMEKQFANPEYVDQIGVSIKMINKKENMGGKEYGQTNQK